MLQADLYYSFRSPYSYLGSWRYKALTQQYDLAIHFKPVYPAAVRFPGFFKARNPLFSPYLLRDVARTAEMIGVPCQRPNPDPVAFKPGTADVADEQPFIYRLTWLGIAAAHRGRGLDFACEVGKTLWGDHVKDWHLGDHLAQAVARAGLDLDELEAAIEGQDAAFDREVRVNQDTQEAAGHWGTPCLVFQNEPFFGQDRIDMAVWRMEQHGLCER